MSNLPSAPELLALSPAKSGFADKKNNSCLAYILPCFFPKFKRRFFILIGGYLYRFSSEHGEKPKGVPIPLDSITISILNETTFQLSMIRKNYIIRTESEAECLSWVRDLRERKAASIREDLGHAPIDPQVVEMNKKAHKLFQEKLRSDRVVGETTMNPISSGMGMGGMGMGGM